MTPGSRCSLFDDCLQSGLRCRSAQTSESAHASGAHVRASCLAASGMLIGLEDPHPLATGNLSLE
jgi:hypothetical protein